MSLYYPIMLKLKGRSCKVIGGGKVAERKVISLLDYGADITVISPNITTTLHNLAGENKIIYIKRDYRPGDLRNCYLAYALTDNPDVNKQCYQEAQVNNTFINMADSEELSDFILPASINRGNLTITVSTKGKSPMLSGKIRRDLESLYGEEYGCIVDTLGDIRSKALNEIISIKDRRELFRQLVYDIDFNNSIDDIKKDMWSIYECFKES